MNRLFHCTLLSILLLRNFGQSDRSKHTSVPRASSGYVERSLDWQTDGLSTTNPVFKSEVRSVHELIERWCTAYGDLDENELAALESPDVEIVDRFGELHVAKQRTDVERFWAEGFEMISRAIEEIRSTRPDVVIVHADIAYSGGIPLKGGDYIPAFSEIHTFIVSRDKAGWRIAGHDITKRALQ